jgi:hypothetical protein
MLLPVYVIGILLLKHHLNLQGMFKRTPHLLLLQKPSSYTFDRVKLCMSGTKKMRDKDLLRNLIAGNVGRR